MLPQHPGRHGWLACRGECPSPDGQQRKELGGALHVLVELPHAPCAAHGTDYWLAVSQPHGRLQGKLQHAVLAAAQPRQRREQQQGPRTGAA